MNDNKFTDIIKEDKKAILNGFKLTSIIFTSLVLIIFAITYFNNIQLDPQLFIIVILSSGLGFPTLIIGIAILRWWWDFTVTKRNFNSSPFDQLDSIGFKKDLINKNSKWRNVSEYFTGIINGFIVDCDVDTQNKSKELRFKFYIKQKRIKKPDIKRIDSDFKKQNGFLDFFSVNKSFHYKKHDLNSINDLEKELTKFTDLIIKQGFEPDNIARR